MKKLIHLFIGVIALLGIMQISYASKTEKAPSKDASITIVCSPELHLLTSSWALDFMSLNPGSQINVVEIGENDISSFIESKAQLAFVSREYLKEKNAQQYWETVVGREIFVPIINQKNPLLEQIYIQGISPENLAKFFESPDAQNWATLLGNEQNFPINFYTINNIAEPGELITSVQEDIYAVGFCRLTDIIDFQNNSMFEGLVLMPIDKNGNGKIDSFEDIYSDLAAFTRGVWMGKYPHEFVSNIYVVSSEKPSSDEEKAFLKWVFTTGQKDLKSSGFSNLASSEINSKLFELQGNQIVAIQETENYATWKIVVMAILVSIILALIVESIVLFFRYRRNKFIVKSSGMSPVFKENSVKAPGGLFFDNTHTWAFMENNGVVKIGIDDFLARVTGQLTGVKMKKAGDKIKKNETLLSIVQNGKQLTIKSPVSGTIVKGNSSLKEEPSLINSSPYNEGWVYIVEPVNWLREIQFLFMADKFRLWVKSEFLRLKDFIAFAQKSNETSYVPLILQEGGEVEEGLLMHFGPEIWEDFQSDFIDKTA